VRSRNFAVSFSEELRVCISISYGRRGLSF